MNAHDMVLKANSMGEMRESNFYISMMWNRKKNMQYYQTLAAFPPLIFFYFSSLREGAEVISLCNLRTTISLNAWYSINIYSINLGVKLKIDIFQPNLKTYKFLFRVFS